MNQFIYYFPVIRRLQNRSPNCHLATAVPMRNRLPFGCLCFVPLFHYGNETNVRNFVSGADLLNYYVNCNHISSHWLLCFGFLLSV